MKKILYGMLMGSVLLFTATSCEKEIEDLVFIYENCNILNADAIRERLKPIIDKYYESEEK